MTIEQSMRTVRASLERARHVEAGSRGACAGCRWSCFEDVMMGEVDGTFDGLKCSHPIAMGEHRFDLVTHSVSAKLTNAATARSYGPCGPEGRLYQPSVIGAGTKSAWMMTPAILRFFFLISVFVAVAIGSVVTAVALLSGG